MRIRYYRNEFLFKERGKMLSSQIGYSEILCRYDGSRPTAIFKNDKEKQCIINDDDYIIFVKRFKNNTNIIINRIDLENITTIDGRCDVELKPILMMDDIEQAPDILKSAITSAIERASIFNCSESVYIE